MSNQRHFKMTSITDNYSDFESDEESDELTSNFNAAAKHLTNLVSTKQLDNDLLVRLYGLYKVASIGKCNVPRPSWYELKAKQKWEAWNQLENVPETEAKQQYIELIKKIDPDWKWIDDSDKSKSWARVSSMIKPDSDIPEHEKTIFDFVKDGNPLKTEQLLNDPIHAKNINAIDENGLGLIHWACDRGNDVMLDLILKYGGDVNLKGTDDQTPLHYAASCGHVTCVELLLRSGADITIVDEDGLTPAEVASDSTIAELITNFKM